MKQETSSPMKLLMWALTGALLTSSMCLFAFLPMPPIVHCHGFIDFIYANRLSILLVLTPFVCGFSLMLFMEGRLKRGVRDGWWSDRELAPVQQLVTGKAWRTTNWVICAVFLCLLFLQVKPEHSRGISLSYYMLLIPMQFMLRLQQVILPSALKKIDPLQDWKSFKPMQSDHWGEAG